MAVIDLALHDRSAELARRILARGQVTLAAVLRAAGYDDDFLYVACPDFSITLRQRRMIVGLPIGGYVNWFGKRAFPIELDVNSCGVHLLELSRPLSKEQIVRAVFDLKQRLDDGELAVGRVGLRWNFTRRNHFIGFYEDRTGERQFLVFHAAGETQLFDFAALKSKFDVREVVVGGRPVPYIVDDDFDEYWEMASRENVHFFERHEEIFAALLPGGHTTVYADQHFGMVGPGELLMGCSRVRPGTLFPLLTRPFEDIYLSQANDPRPEILAATNGHSLVPHGLGMVVPDCVEDIVGLPDGSDYVEVISANGGTMITDVLEYVGVSYRMPSVLPEMEAGGTFTVVEPLHPIVCFKL
jgi:hypothetical protein